jgi:hypothetical protein
MLGGHEVSACRVGKFYDMGRSQNVCHKHHGCVQRDMCSRQNTRRLRRNHRLAAIVGLVRRVARHGATALHALLVFGRCGHAVSKLQAQQGHH